MAAYYNENDPKIAAWLKELIKRGLVADGEVDTRSIVDVRPDDLSGFVQCHFFAGIGGWSYALRLAGWPDERRVWTGSCPCQPFSQGGLGAGSEDARHLWPVWRPLITQCRPPVVVGEQVAGPSGRSWVDLVAGDLEDDVYAFAAADLPVASVDGLHIRHRMWWLAVAHSNADRVRWERVEQTSQRSQSKDPWFRRSEFEGLVSAARQLAVPAGRCGAVADGVSGRVGRLRGYGNAIVPQVAAEFIAAYLEAEAATVTQ
jgi:DNA (cytosine-5)-methyltransferase 1